MKRAGILLRQYEGKSFWNLKGILAEKYGSDVKYVKE